MLVIENDGKKITQTNFYQTELGQQKFYLSINAGAFRVLIPKMHVLTLKKELEITNYVLFERGSWPPYASDAICITLMDGSDNPWRVSLLMNAVDRVPTSGTVIEKGIVYFYVPADDGSAKLYKKFQAKYREVDRIY